MHASTALTLLLCATLAGPALAQGDGLQHCRSITDPTARLACYDALAAAPKPPAPPAAPAAAVTPAAVAPTVAAVAAAPTPKPADNFGLPVSKRSDEVQSVQSSTGPNFSGWGPNQHIKLANGQVWQITDGSSVVLEPGARKVTVKRASLGSFVLDFEGLNTTPRVRRVQ